MVHLRCYAEVFKEALMGGPELTPHCLLHAILCIHQLSSFLELLHGLHPLNKGTDHSTKEDEVFTATGMLRLIKAGDTRFSRQ